MGFQDIELEGDALSIIKLMKSHGDDLSIVSNLIKEAKCISLSFHSCIFMYARRKRNIVADSLAKYAK
ncbi:hypothetical protein CRYUN_Cryun09bG0212400 [Craigia yunnanensis]